jgi:hypothetical protein
MGNMDDDSNPFLLVFPVLLYSVRYRDELADNRLMGRRCADLMSDVCY